MSSSLKSRLRETYRLKRNALLPADHAKLSHAACEHAFCLLTELARPGNMIAGYAPVRSEPDIMPLLKRLSVGHSVALPVSIEKLGLDFKRYHPGDTLEPGLHDIPEPAAGAESVVPDLLLVPLLAFDRSGHRLGSGMGYYDRTLLALRHARPVIAIGIAFSLQEAGSLPAESFDQILDAVVTEREIIRFP